MAKRTQIQLTRFELEIMEVLWRIGESSVREVQEGLQERRRPAYTTVQTIFGRLEEKKAVRRTRKIGNAFLYEPLITRTSAYRRLVEDFLAFFGGSARPLVAHLLESGKLTLEDLKTIEDNGTAGASEDEK
ncbi:MAG: BlaI/MecI/CopY family transcriptional regulator [Acidobacteria bacterium]|nr:BlaI/MecI/CopY family transcriptional regulator [Acidobacteriota bacterium]MBV9478025.1 BlaI/MecI/CopY family transcriptional regulator [Acidobacteriota bacterium]